MTDKQLREWLLDKVPEAPDEYPPVDDRPVPTVSVSALGGSSVEVKGQDFECLLAQAGVIPFADLSQSDMGRLLTAAKDHGPRHLLQALLSIRCPASPVYRIRVGGRPWRPLAAYQTAVPTGIEP
jgi:hypothetical protein